MSAITSIDIETFLMMLVASAFGFIGHVFAKVGELRQTQASRLTFVGYLLSTPYKTTGKVIGVLIGVGLMAQSQISIQTLAGAAAIGWAADSLGNHLRR